jgi:hypothetical protein
MATQAQAPGASSALASAELGAWFRDSEGNLLGIGQPVY